MVIFLKAKSDANMHQLAPLNLKKNSHGSMLPNPLAKRMALRHANLKI